MAAPSYERAVGPAPSPRPAPSPVAASQERSSHVRHIARDHSYVPGEVRLIALLTAVIIAGLVITAILR